MIQTDKEIKLSQLKVADILHTSYNSSISSQCGKCKNVIVIFDDRNIPQTQELNMKLVLSALLKWRQQSGLRIKIKEK